MVGRGLVHTVGGALLGLLVSSRLVRCLLVVRILCLVLVHARSSILLSLLIGGSLVCCSHLLGCILRLALVHHLGGGSILLCLSIGSSLLLFGYRGSVKSLERIVTRRTCLSGLLIGILALALAIALSGLLSSGSILCSLVLSAIVASCRSILSIGTFGVGISIIFAHATACCQERTAELEGFLAKLLHNVFLAATEVCRGHDYILGASGDYRSLAHERRWSCCHEGG